MYQLALAQSVFFSLRRVFYLHLCQRIRGAVYRTGERVTLFLQDDWYDYSGLFSLLPEGYVDPSSAAVRQDRDGVMRAGGYIVEQAWERAIRCAVAGLDIPPLVGGLDLLPSSLAQSLGSDGDVVMQTA